MLTRNCPKCKCIITYSCRISQRSGERRNSTCLKCRKTAPVLPINERFYKHITKTDNCWEWSAAIEKGTGYGIMNVDGHCKRTHRVSWEIHNGPIPNGMCVCHKCDNRKCVRPDHLFLGTDADNMNDKVNKGRQSKGRDFHRSNLNDSDIRFIRSSQLQNKALGRMFGIHFNSVADIKHRRTWKHVV